MVKGPIWPSSVKTSRWTDEDDEKMNLGYGRRKVWKRRKEELGKVESTSP